MNQIRSRDKSILRRYEVIGAVIVCILAPVFHFLFEWSGGNPFVGIFAAVNESVWEHTKIVYPETGLSAFPHRQSNLYGAYLAADGHLFLYVFRYVRRRKPDRRYYLYLCAHDHRFYGLL